jgi:predicted MPP superfamily phosphohydrolase
MKVISRDLPQYDELEIYIYADVHREDPLHDHRRRQQWMNEVLSAPNRYVILNGDLLNMATIDSVSDTFAQKMEPDAAIDKMSDELKPIRDRILVMTEGNHEFRGYKNTGIKIMHRIARELDINDTYSEGAYILFVSFGKSKYRESRKMPYAIYGKHGAGGGRKAGAKAIRLLEMAETVDADIYIHSHTHLPMIIPGLFYRCDYRNRKVTPVDKMFINTNAFLLPGGYGEEKGMAPVSTKYPKIILNGIKREIKVII